MSGFDYRVNPGMPTLQSYHGRHNSKTDQRSTNTTDSPVRYSTESGATTLGRNMADSYRDFDKSDTSPIIPEIRISSYSFRVREIILGVVSVVALVACLVLIAIVATNSSSSTDETNTLSRTSSQTAQDSLCLEAPCLRGAAYAVANMNMSLKPCDNFYQYACGNFPKQNPLSPNVPQRTIYWNMYYDNEDKLRNLLEGPTIRTSTWSSEKKLKDFFMSCLDDYGKMNAGGKTFIDKIIQPLGGWDVLNTFNAQTFDFQANLQKTSVDFWTAALFTFRVATDRYNPSNRVIEVDMAGMGMLWAYFTRENTQQIRDDYKKFMRTVAQLLARDSGLQLDPSVRDNKIETFVNDAYDIEFQLANITANTLPTSDPHNHEKRITISAFTQETGNVVDFMSFFQYIFGSSVVSSGTQVILMEDDWIRRMLAMVQNLPAADKNRKLQNYMIWRLAQSYATELSWDYIHASRDFFVDQYGVADFLGTWRHCFYLADQKFPDALGALFIKDHFADTNKAKAEEIVSYVKQALMDSIDKNTIMDDATKAIAKTKLQASTDKIGYPAFYDTDSELDNIYQAVAINRTDYFQNLLNLNQFEKADWTRRLTTGEDRTQWPYKSYDTTMTFFNTWNELLIPAGMMQFPVYEWTLPHYFNFGTMGGLVGHYLVHAIDSWGSFYDQNGQYGLWWSNTTTNNYLPAQNCFSNVFGNKTMGPYTVQGAPQTVQVDGPRFAWEGMAETNGVRIAYEAYKKWIADKGAEKVAPTLHYTNDQSFFLAYAQSHCFNRNDQLAYSYAISQRVSEDVRANTALSLLPEFASAFGCPAGSPMNSDTKCPMF